MKFGELIYRSPVGKIMSFAARCIAKLHKPFMVYGFKDPKTGIFRKYTRFSSDLTILSPEKLSVENNVWIWHHSIIDATEGLEIGEGVQIGAWVGVFTHGSENSIRLLGSQFVNIPNTERKGYTRGSVSIGAYSFIGAKSVILPGVTIGKGCLIAAGSIVSKNIPDYSIYVGHQITSRTTIEKDRQFFEQEDFSQTYYDKEA
ncbi:MAG: acyltransferase, partial [Bacteroidales bacterium]